MPKVGWFVPGAALLPLFLAGIMGIKLVKEKHSFSEPKMSVMAGHFGSRPDTRINMMFSIRFFGVCHVSLTIGSYADEDAGRSEDFLRAPRCLVGMVCNLAKRILHVSGGGDWDTWRDQSPSYTKGTHQTASLDKHRIRVP